MNENPQIDQSNPKDTTSALLTWIVCPVSKTRLIYDKQRQVLISTVAKLEYPIEHGIALLVKSQATNCESK